MPIIAKGGGGPRDPVPIGNHVARCYSIIEVGTVFKDWQGTKRSTYEVRIGFELPDLLIDYEGEKKPMVMFLTRNLTLGRNSRLRSELESWRGQPFTEEELKGFDISRLIGVPAMLNVIHTEQGYDRVHAITPVPPSFQANLQPQFNPTEMLAYDQWDQNMFDKLPEFLRDIITGTPEYRAKFGLPAVDPTGPQVQPVQPTGEAKPVPEHAQVNPAKPIEPVIEHREQPVQTPEVDEHGNPKEPPF